MKYQLTKWIANGVIKILNIFDNLKPKRPNLDLEKEEFKTFKNKISRMPLGFWIGIVGGMTWLLIAIIGSDDLCYTFSIKALMLFRSSSPVDVSHPVGDYGERSRLFCFIIGVLALGYSIRRYSKEKNAT